MTLLTTQEAADRLKVHPETVRRMIHRGELEALPLGRQYRITEESLAGAVGSKVGTTSSCTESHRVDSSSAKQKSQTDRKPWAKGWDD